MTTQPDLDNLAKSLTAMEGLRFQSGVAGPYLTGRKPDTNRIIHMSTTVGCPQDGDLMECGLSYRRGNFDGHAYFGADEIGNRHFVTCSACRDRLKQQEGADGHQ